MGWREMMSKKKKFKTVQDVYDAIPSIDCQGLCHESCGPIMMSNVERSRMAAAGKTPPSLDNLAPGLNCIQLQLNRKCGAYQVRPLVCRLFGVVAVMPCPFGCKPERWLPEREARHLQKELDRMSDRPSEFGLSKEAIV
ncbi:MAG: YkgJ family cysteine cluster protein [Cyanobacteria bacterium P01_F01_bin.153]